MASKLHKFRELVDEIEDLEQLRVGAHLMQDLVEIIQCRQKIAKLEGGLTEGGKAMFYFFAMGLSDDEVSYGAEKIVGKVKRMDERVRAEREKAEAEALEKLKQEQAKLEVESKLEDSDAGKIEEKPKKTKKKKFIFKEGEVANNPK